MMPCSTSLCFSARSERSWRSASSIALSSFVLVLSAPSAEMPPRLDCAHISVTRPCRRPSASCMPFSRLDSTESCKLVIRACSCTACWLKEWLRASRAVFLTLSRIFSRSAACWCEGSSPSLSCSIDASRKFTRSPSFARKSIPGSRIGGGVLPTPSSGLSVDTAWLLHVDLAGRQTVVDRGVVRQRVSSGFTSDPGAGGGTVPSGGGGGGAWPCAMRNEPCDCATCT
mmetsp:Transcript_62397/g.177335  ORF Transcript_62397/g.177335 Transcript_62397/m.177335 type:complete len:228 (-) Transcript_62397:375-1058(-)